MNSTLVLNKRLSQYIELFDSIYEASLNGHELFKIEDLPLEDHEVQRIIGPGFTLSRDDTPHHQSYAYSNGIDSFSISRIIYSKAIVKIGTEEFSGMDIVTNPKSIIFLKDIATTLKFQLQKKTEKPKELSINQTKSSSNQS